MSADQHAFTVDRMRDARAMIRAGATTQHMYDVMAKALAIVRDRGMLRGPGITTLKVKWRGCTDVAIQINGKVRKKIEVDIDTPQAEIEKIATDLDEIKKYIENKKIKKIIYIQNKLVNIVV